jgi:uncharacterized protein YoxC
MKSKIIYVVIALAVAVAIFFVVRYLLSANKAMKEAKSEALPVVNTETK